jgi:hypothetical protein
MSKGQGLPITTIIIAALGILVLIIIAAIFSGQIGTIGRITAVCPVGNPCVEQTGITSARTEFEKLGTENGPRCPEGSTPLSEIRVKPGQPKDRPADETIYCAPCCVPVG